MQNKTLLAKIAAILVIIFACFRLLSFCTSRSGAPPEATRHAQALGAVTAAEVADRLGSGTSVLLVLSPSNNPHLRERERSFRSVARQRDLNIVGVVETQSGDSHPERGWSRDFYQRMVRQHPEVDVIVSFDGLPPDHLPRVSQDRLYSGAFVAVLPHSQHLDDFLRTNLVAFAVLPVPMPRGEDLSIRTADRVWFDAFYQIVDTPRTAPDSEVLPSPPREEELEIIDDFLGPVRS